MTNRTRIYLLHKTIVLSLLLICSNKSIAQNITSFIEAGTTLHTGDYTPLWQVSNQHGLSSLDNNGYLRGAVFYKDTVNNWKYHFGADVAVGAGLNTVFVPQQIFADIQYRWLGLWAGCREIDSPLLNQQLSSGGLTWSGNARPVPQVCIGIPEYVHLGPVVQFKAEISYGWFTDGRYQRKHVGNGFPYAKQIKYHHKSFFFRFGKETSNWQVDIGMQIDNQFGGYSVLGDEVTDFGNTWKDYATAFIPFNRGEGIFFDGNLLGSEHIKLTYKHKEFNISAYLENFYEDFSGMGKLNGMDGLWGIEVNMKNFKPITDLVVEYYQSTNQSGPMHGWDFSIVGKTGGADNYYNHAYSGWTHWGMMNSNPLIVANIYNKDGFLSLRHTRIKAMHIGWKGEIAPQVDYRAKFSFNRSWGTPFEPTAQILENFSGFAEVIYKPNKLKGWRFTGSLAFDTGDLYGDNFGFQLKIRKTLR